MAIAGAEEFEPEGMYDEDVVSDYYNAGELYTVEAVREILIKFAHVIVNGDENYDIPDETIVRGVNEFMGIGGDDDI